MKWVLAISGGGMRGVIPARLMAEIEKRTGRLVSETFDLITGTSTGSILAALASKPNPPAAQRMIDFYFSSGPKIFRRGMFDWGIVGPKYRQEDLQRELRACIGESVCRELGVKVMIPTVDANAADAVFIKSWDPWWDEFPLWGAAAASSSAQTFFPAFAGQYRNREYRYLDGGNHTNNPAAAGLFEAYRLWPGEEIGVVHVGTGKQTQPRPLPDGGIARWAPLVFGTTSECQDDCARYFCEHAPGVRFFSLDVNLERFPGMDDASRETLDELMYWTHHSIIRNGKTWEELVDALT